MPYNAEAEWHRRERKRVMLRDKALDAIAYTLGLIVTAPVHPSPEIVNKYLQEYADVFYGNIKARDRCIEEYCPGIPSDENVVKIAIAAGQRYWKKYLKEVARPARQRRLLDIGAENQKLFFVRTSLRWIVVDGLTTADDMNELVQLSLTDYTGRVLFAQLLRPRYYHADWSTDLDLLEISRSELHKNYYSIRRYRSQIQRIIDHAEGILLYDRGLCDLLRAANLNVPDSLPKISVKDKFVERYHENPEIKLPTLAVCADYCAYPWHGYNHDAVANCRALIYCARKMEIKLESPASTSNTESPPDTTDETEK